MFLHAWNGNLNSSKFQSLWILSKEIPIGRRRQCLRTTFCTCCSPMPAQAAFDIIGKKRKAPASGPVPLLTACLLQRGILVTGEKKKKKSMMPQTKSTFFSLKICTYFILCFLYFLNSFFKNSLKTSTDVDMDYLKEKAKNCAKCNFYNQV